MHSLQRRKSRVDRGRNAAAKGEGTKTNPSWVSGCRTKAKKIRGKG